MRRESPRRPPDLAARTRTIQARMSRRGPVPPATRELPGVPPKRLPSISSFASVTRAVPLLLRQHLLQALTKDPHCSGVAPRPVRALTGQRVERRLLWLHLAVARDGIHRSDPLVDRAGVGELAGPGERGGLGKDDRAGIGRERALRHLDNAYLNGIRTLAAGTGAGERVVIRAARNVRKSFGAAHRPRATPGA